MVKTNSDIAQAFLGDYRANGEASDQEVVKSFAMPGQNKQVVGQVLDIQQS